MTIPPTSQWQRTQSAFGNTWRMRMNAFGRQNVKLTMHAKHRLAFTFIELLVVIAVIGILAAQFP